MIIFFVLSHAGVKNIVCYPEDFVTHMYLEFCYLQVPLCCKPIDGANIDGEAAQLLKVQCRHGSWHSHLLSCAALT